MKPLIQYIQIKDKCAIYYLGNSYEYVVQIICLMPYIQKALPNLEIDVFCKDEVAKTIGAKPLSYFEKNKYGFTYEITYNLDSHSIEDLLKESNISYGPVDVPNIDNNTLYAICPYASLPSKSLNNIQIQKIKEVAEKEKYTFTENTLNAGWIIGPENYELFLAASKGVRTSLVPTGYGENLYKTMFPNGEILIL